MSKKLRSIVYEHSSGHLVATAATEEQLGRIKDILCEPRTEACNAAGRQLYEPEQLLADAKVGDLCKTDIDEWIQIDDTSEPPSPILYHFDRPFNGNIIHTEPLAPEGTDKWAWQMMLLGKKVCQKHNSYFPNKRYYAIKDGNDYCAFYENNGNEVNITNTRRTYDEFIEYCKFTPQYNWQLYTELQTEPCDACAGIGMILCEACNATGRVPISQPTYAVGDWVEYFDNAELCHAQIDEIDSDYCTINPVVGWDRTLQRIRITCITRKLDPSEVVVDFGNGIFGTIEPSIYPTWINVRKNSDWGTIASIFVLDLDEPIQTLVKELLEKQKEEK
jgi:hypothetical protein